jgi:WD40 repeat protein
MQAFAFSPDGDRLALVREGDVRPRFLDTATWQEVDEPRGPSARIDGLAVSPDGKRAAIATTGIEVWDVDTRALVRRFGAAQHGVGVAALAFSPDGTQVVSTGWDKELYVWDVASGSMRSTPLGFTAHNLAVTAEVVVAAGERRVCAVGWSDLVQRWSLEGGEEDPGDPDKHPATGAQNAICTPTAIVVHEPDCERVLDPDSGAERWRMAVPAGLGVTDYHCFGGLTASGRLMIDRGLALRVLDHAAGTVAVRLEPWSPGEFALPTLSPDGAIVVLTAPDGLVVAQADTLAPLARLTVPELSGEIAFSGDGRRLVGCTTSGDLLVWEVASLLGR